MPTMELALLYVPDGEDPLRVVSSSNHEQVVEFARWVLAEAKTRIGRRGNDPLLRQADVLDYERMRGLIENFVPGATTPPAKQEPALTTHRPTTMQ